MQLSQYIVYFLLALAVVGCSAELLFYFMAFLALLATVGTYFTQPHNLMAAAGGVAFFWLWGSYRRLESWLFGSRLSRVLLIFMHLAAGLIAGRIIGIAVYDLLDNVLSANATPRAFETAGALIVSLLNVRFFLSRKQVTLRAC